MMTLLDVLDCSFSDSFVQRFSAPGRNKPKDEWLEKSHDTYVRHMIPESSLSLTLLLRDGPHHEVHAGSVGLAAQLERVQLALQILHVMQDPLQLRLTAAELLQNEVMNLLHERHLQVCAHQTIT